MKHLSDDDLTKELKKLDLSVQLSSIQREKMKKHLFEKQPTIKTQQTHKWLHAITFIVVLFTILVVVIPLLQNEFEINSEYPSINPIIDLITPEKLSVVPQTENTFLIEWPFDSMDRGNHDLNTHIHGKLVATPDVHKLQRGQVVYYQTPPVQLDNIDANIPEMYIGRVVGLSGESVEIKNGQVYINEQLLDTFYGKATTYGLNEEEYFNKMDPKNIENEKEMRNYFKTEMAAVTVQENTVFILVDQWWRGIDSRYYGTLPIEKIKGVVIGYDE